MTQDDKPARGQARLPRGFADRGPAELAATQKMLEAIRASYELYGFEAVETPFVEFTDALGKFLPDLDRPNEGVFSFKDDDESWLSLRYDLTAPLARFVAENYDRLPKPYRSYRAGYVFRNEKPGPGRFRQFMQFDADTVGSASVAADAEMCMMAADTLEKLGVPRGGYVIKVNNRKVLDGVLEAIGLGGDENAGRRLTVLRAIDKLDKFGPEGVALLLGPGRRDESGDFTKGAGLDNAQTAQIFNFVGELRDLKGPEHGRRFDNRYTVLRWRKIVEQSVIGAEGVNELLQFSDLINAAEYDDRVQITSETVRGLEYYTGPVFEAELTFEVAGEDGKPVRFGSVGGGGRYDGLVGRFRAENVPATGFSIGVSRLYAALKAVGSPIVAQGAQHGPVVVLVLDKGETARYQRFVADLRAAGVSAELYLGSSGMNAQLKYADKRGSRCAIIQGTNEREHADGPQVTIRDLALGAKIAGMNKDRADYLEMRGKAQFTVPETRLVEAVREVLARGG
ncbi:histidine--tRNA ligase [Methylocella sp.]|uniref:histidine--tRNA ligase n=1 Tax=Methylocella sp. TaxID=1978226 RepID=UPI0035AF5687